MTLFFTYIEVRKFDVSTHNTTISLSARKQLLKVLSNIFQYFFPSNFVTNVRAIFRVFSYNENANGIF